MYIVSEVRGMSAASRTLMAVLVVVSSQALCPHRKVGHTCFPYLHGVMNERKELICTLRKKERVQGWALAGGYHWQIRRLPAGNEHFFKLDR